MTRRPERSVLPLLPRREERGGERRGIFAPVAPPQPSRGEKEHRFPRGDEPRGSGLAKARRAILPLLGERAGVRGKKRSSNQRAFELPMDLATLSEGKQSPAPSKAPSP